MNNNDTVRDNGHNGIAPARILVIDDEEVLIVNPETRRVLPENKIGEIWINSPSSGQGYWQRPVETAETFMAKS